MTLLPTPLEEAAKAIRAERGLFGKPNASTITQATAAITTYLAQAGKEGWVMVPLNPNYDMGEAGMGKFASFHDEHPAACVDEIYRAMIAARPSPGAADE